MLAATANKTLPTGFMKFHSSTLNVSFIRTPSLAAVNTAIKNEGCSNKRAAVTSKKIAFAKLAFTRFELVSPGRR